MLVPAPQKGLSPKCRLARAARPRISLEEQLGVPALGAAAAVTSVAGLA